MKKFRIIKVNENYETYYIIKKKGTFFWYSVTEPDPYNVVYYRVKKFWHLDDAESYVDKEINKPPTKETVVKEY